MPPSACSGCVPEATVSEAGNEKITQMFERVCQEERPFQPKGYDAAIQIFVEEEEHFFLPQAIPIFDQPRQLVGVTLMLADVTRLRRLDEVKTGLISTVSHELKTPLTSIRLALHVLLNEKLGPLSPQQMELLATARQDSDRLHRVIEDLLDISRMESGGAEMQFEPVNVQDLVLQATDKMRSAFLDQKITLHLEVAPEVPRVLIDPTRFHLVFDNLLGNALKYTSAGGEVSIAARPEDGLVSFTVEDTGSGIAPEYLPRIFEKFFRVPGQDSHRLGPGTHYRQGDRGGPRRDYHRRQPTRQGHQIYLHREGCQRVWLRMCSDPNCKEILGYGLRVDYHPPHFLCHLPGLRRLPGPGGQDMENLIVGLVAVALIVYLFVVLLRPHKF